MPNFIITFGQRHTHRINNYTFDKDSVAIIEAETCNDAHDIAMDIFNEEFHKCISEEAYDISDKAKYFPRGKHKAN